VGDKDFTCKFTATRERHSQAGRHVMLLSLRSTRFDVWRIKVRQTQRAVPTSWINSQLMFMPEH
jgi:hypothetical protein